MLTFFFQLFGWLPPILQVLVLGAVSIFVVWAVMKIAGLIMDIIPFL